MRARQKQLGAWLVVIRATRPEDASFVADNSFFFVVAAQPRTAAAFIMISGSLQARKNKKKKIPLQKETDKLKCCN